MRIPIAHIEPELTATERFGVIRELVDRLVHAGSVPRKARDSVLQALCDRESVMSTGIGRQLAIPHAGSAALSKPVVAFGRSRPGIAFDALDGVPVQFVFLFIVPRARPPNERQLEFLTRVCRGMGSPRTLEAVRRSSTAEEISAVLDDAFDE